jgi:AraC family transcriptional regulator
MILHEFPDLQWLKSQAEKRFAEKRSYSGEKLEREGWPSVVLNVKTTSTYRDNIRGPLSMFSNFSGESVVEVDGRRFTVREGFFFVSNSDQYYSLGLEGKETETANIHFGEYFVENILISATLAPELLLENNTSKQERNFHNAIYRKTDALDQITRQIAAIQNDKLLLEEKLVACAIELLRTSQADHTRMQRIPLVKNSTRREIIRRLLSARDVIYTCYQADLSLDDLANACCLSKFHFLRLFKIAFGKTPHQFLNEVRMQRAKELLHKNRMEIYQISSEVGIKDSASFSRLFKNQTGLYPTQYRNYVS